MVVQSLFNRSIDYVHTYEYIAVETCTSAMAKARLLEYQLAVMSMPYQARQVLFRPPHSAEISHSLAVDPSFLQHNRPVVPLPTRIDLPLREVLILGHWAVTKYPQVVDQLRRLLAFEKYIAQTRHHQRKPFLAHVLRVHDARSRQY